MGSLSNRGRAHITSACGSSRPAPVQLQRALCMLSRSLHPAAAPRLCTLSFALPCAVQRSSSLWRCASLPATPVARCRTSSASAATVRRAPLRLLRARGGCGAMHAAALCGACAFLLHCRVLPSCPNAAWACKTTAWVASQQPVSPFLALHPPFHQPAQPHPQGAATSQRRLWERLWRVCRRGAGG